MLPALFSSFVVGTCKAWYKVASWASKSNENRACGRLQVCAHVLLLEPRDLSQPVILQSRQNRQKRANPRRSARWVEYLVQNFTPQF